MKELLFFSFAGLLVRVEYSKEANALKYSSHREISLSERVVVEQYLLSNFALKTEYYNRHPALFIYLGKDICLEKDLNLFHLKNTLKFFAHKEKEIKQQVNELIANSMSNYYFEQIGNEILTLRKTINNNYDEYTLRQSRHKMNELIKAFNLYSKKQISLDDVIPLDLKEYLQFKGREMGEIIGEHEK